MLDRLRVRSGSSHNACPRSGLKKLLEMLEQEHGLDFRVGFETEFYLLRGQSSKHGTELVPVDQSLYCQTSALNAVAPGTLLSTSAAAASEAVSNMQFACNAALKQTQLAGHSSLQST